MENPIETKKYVIQGGVEGRERLRLLSDVMGQPTRALLAEVGIPAGSVCLDVGCGGGDVTFELARATGPTGRVIGVDLDATVIDLARRERDQLGLSNITFEVQDVTSWTPDELVDVVYARFLLTHLADPGALIAILNRLIRPGGVLIVEDIDFRGHFAEPACSALARYVELYTRSVQARGADPNIGPRIPGLLRAAGFNEIMMKLHHPTALEGGIKLLTCVTLERIAQTELGDGLVTEEEMQVLIADLYEFALDPHTVLGGPRIFQVWGRTGK